MAPPRLKPAKKKRDSTKLVNKDDYLDAADGHEEAMGKHRVGDPVKALRFADRALDVYSEGLTKFPRSFDLAYNKARLELEKATDTVLSQALRVPTLSVLRQAFSSHQYALDINPTHTDTMFNMAQVLTGMAEIIAQDDEADDSEALQYIKRAMEVQISCFELQRIAFEKSRLELERAMRETAEYSTDQIDSGQAITNPASESQRITREEQWAVVEEPITAVTLLETIIAQIEALTAFCSMISSSLASSPEAVHASDSASALSWIDSYSENLLTQKLPTLIDDNKSTLESRLSDVMLPRAIFMGNYLDLSFRLSKIDIKKYTSELASAFAQPGLDVTSEDFLWASAHALLSLNSTLTLVSTGESDASVASVRWTALTAAQSRLSSIASRPNIDKHALATTHLLRGDISLFLQMLSYPPIAHPKARAMTPLKHAEVYYRNAGKLLDSLGRSTEDERIVCELKGAVVNVLLSSSSGKEDHSIIVNMPTSEEIERALGAVLKEKGGQWVKDHLEEMAGQGMVIIPQVFSAVMQG
ncbi:hypothetical protein FHL15_007241 [Xylaria flabelliformis]|uniref:Uncharacterized protein n=1 Tax=Xylaria flabelliformis TaxID=2512241 RepID=A0A553HVF6_9PEZI|nr:hypothetical protein FHL15_007241 [Xylaria flabelliformis]